MKIFRIFLVTGAVLFGGGVIALPSASAQAAFKPKIQVAQAASTAAKASQASKWTCASRESFEIAPVSSDVESGGEQYVLIHIRDGEPVASERITAAEATAFKRLGCKAGDRLEGGESAFVGG